VFEFNLFVLKKWLGQLLMPLPFSLSLLLLAIGLLWFTRFQKTGRSGCSGSPVSRKPASCWRPCRL